MKIINSFKYAGQGIWYCIKSGNNFRIQLVLAAVAVIAGISKNISNTEWLVICLCIGFVLVLEMMNTAIEKLCDEVTMEIKPAIKIIKDVAAGAVLVASVISLIIGIIIFVPKIFI